MIAVCKRHGIVKCHQCNPRIELNQVVGQCQSCKNSLPFCTCKKDNPYQLTKEEKENIKNIDNAFNKLFKESMWSTKRVIEFVNWYIDLKELGENNKLENFTIIESFLDGDSVDVRKNIKSIPEIFTFLRKNFTYDNENEVFQSKKRKLGVGSGDDSSLFIASNGSGTTVWWKENRGFETTIFDGKELKTEEEFNQVFELLEIPKLLKWG